RARQADGPQDFIAAKIIHHLHAVCAAGITCLKRGQERLDGNVDGKIVEFFTGRRLEMHFVRRARTRDEHVASMNLPRDPRSAHIAFTKLRHSPKVAGNVGFWGGGHEKTINHARKPPAPSIKPRPLERHAIGHHFAGEIPGKSGGGAAFGSARVHIFPIFESVHTKAWTAWRSSSIKTASGFSALRLAR